MTVHGAEITLEENWQKEQRLIRYLLKKNSQIITVSNFTGNTLKTRGFQGKIRVIPNGIDAQAFYTSPEEIIHVRRQYKIPDHKKIILYLSSFKDWKGPDVYLKSLPLVEPPYQAIMIGNDLGYLEYCKKLADALKIAGNVRMYPDLPFREIMAFYHIADVFVFPTKFPSEGFGIVALEAMAAGTPVVASRIAAIPEVVKDGETGLLFEPGNPQDLAEKINTVLLDTDLYQKLQDNGIKAVETLYNWSPITRQVLNVYREMI
jgi:glycosyltransferase involved in cell wall biosynthesis